MDVFDPSVAPGVSTPAPAGFVPERFFDLIHKLKDKMEVVGFDVVETCPPKDDANMTSLLASEVIKEAVLAFRK